MKTQNNGHRARRDFPLHLQQNAGHHVTKREHRARIAGELRTVCNAPSREEAERYLRLQRLRTSNLAERQMKEIKRRTKVAMIFPNKDSLTRIVSAILMEIDETWEDGKRYLDMEAE